MNSQSNKYNDNLYNKIIKNCIELHIDKINKLYKNIKKINPDNFILYFLNNNLELKKYIKIIKNNKIIYINNENNDKYNYYFSFNRNNAYILFSLNFIYKNINLNIFTIKCKILKNRYHFNTNILLYSSVYNLKIKNLTSSLRNIQYKLAETLTEIININLLLLID